MTPLMTIQNVMDYTQLSERTIRKRVADKELVAWKTGNIVRFKKSDVDAMFERKK